MLDEAEEAMEYQQTRFDQLDSQVKKLIDNSGLNQCAWIVILIVLLAFLLFLIVYT